MKIDRLVIVLGIYIFVMGIWGMSRTGSWAPLMISGGVAAVTVWIGWMMSRHIQSARGVAIGWLIVVGGAFLLAALGGIPDHPETSTVSVLIFGSMALFAVTALVLILRTPPRRWSGPIRPSRRF